MEGGSESGPTRGVLFFPPSPEFNKRRQSLGDRTLDLEIWLGHGAPLKIIYLRQDGKKLLAAERFGNLSLTKSLHQMTRAELLALEAMRQGKSEAEVVGLLEGPENRQYKIDLEKFGKIKRDGR